jgi:hypothetical protein
MLKRLATPRTWAERITDVLTEGPAPINELVSAIAVGGRNPRYEAGRAVKAFVASGRARMRPMFEPGRMTKHERAAPVIVVELSPSGETE